MVASTHWLASATAMSILDSGGNAFDALVAGGFVLQVVEPHLNGPGGEVPIVLSDASNGEVFVVDGQGPTPAAATIERFASMGYELIPGTGPLSACVPGAFGGWMKTLDRFGTLEVGDVLGPAISYARGGFPVLARLSQTLEAMRETFEREWPGSAEVFLADGVPGPGTLMKNPQLALTYESIVADAVGPNRSARIDAATRAFYEGRVATVIEKEMVGWEGFLSANDMASWRASVEPPVTTTFDGWLVHKPGPWTQGPAFLQQLNLLDPEELRGQGAGSAAHLHSCIEGAKLAFADRDAWYGDPRAVDVPLETLLSKDYARARRSLIGKHASLDLRPGMPGSVQPTLPDLRASGERSTGQSGEPLTTGPPRGDTCHISVVDAAGNLAAATPSGGWLQSSPAIAELGFPLGTRAQTMWLQPGLPNSLRPGVRPRSTLSPTLAVHEDGRRLGFGTPGGDAQDQWTLKFFIDHAVHSMELQEAIDSPSWWTEHLIGSFFPRPFKPGSVTIETRVAEDVRAELRSRGHGLIEAGEWSLGRVCAVEWAPDHTVSAAADARSGQAYAVGR